MPNDNSQPTTMRSLKQLVRTCVEDEAEYIRENKYPDDSLHEIADGCVPVYHSELLEVAQSDLWLAVDTPDFLAFDGECTAVNAIAGNIYQELLETAYEAWNELEAKDA